MIFTIQAWDGRIFHNVGIVACDAETQAVTTPKSDRQTTIIRREEQAAANAAAFFTAIFATFDKGRSRL